MENLRIPMNISLVNTIHLRGYNTWGRENWNLIDVIFFYNSICTGLQTMLFCNFSVTTSNIKYRFCVTMPVWKTVFSFIHSAVDQSYTKAVSALSLLFVTSWPDVSFLDVSCFVGSIRLLTTASYYFLYFHFSFPNNPCLVPGCRLL